MGGEGVLSWAEVDWLCRSTKIFCNNIFKHENLLHYTQEVGRYFFHVVSSQITLYIAQMQYMYDFLQTLFQTAILGDEGTVMKVSTKYNRCDLFQTMSELSG